MSAARPVSGDLIEPRRRSVRSLAGIAVLALLALLNLGLWARKMTTVGIHTDFPSYLTFAYLGLHSGWSHLYNWQETKSIAEMFGAAYWPNQYPPFTFWLFVPFLFLPYPVAYFLFLALMALALVGTWRLLAPGPARLPHLLVMFAFLPVGFALWLGQVVPLVALLVALSWWLLERRRDLLAGVVLFGIILKPNLAVLVPLVLIAAGRWRAVAGFAAACAVGGLLALLVLTPYGIGQYYGHLRSITAEQPHLIIDSGLTMVGLFGVGPVLLAADLAVLAAVVWISRVTRGEGAAPGFAAAIAGSLLVTTYLHWQDLVMLLPASWLWLRSRPNRRYGILCLVVVWGIANFTLAVPQVLLAWLGVMAAEAAWRRRGQPASALRSAAAEAGP